ncbi:beta-N-acetylhexosaminidase [Chitinophaga sp. MM2321]|uniref:beta-N-acetylhexosaminidase n=1 Tax=Chitinophaga sp. MM2321 TaxID=3137178 RepID=UPI0032D59CB7
MERIHTRFFIQLLFVCLMMAGIGCGDVNTTHHPTAGERALASLLPVPQQAKFSADTFLLDDNWHVEATANGEDRPAFESLMEGLGEKKMHLKSLPAGDAASASPVIRLVVKAGSVPIQPTVDTSRTSLEKQAYQLTLDAAGITVTANASQGLYYGVQTLLQLINASGEKVWLPKGEITDWPELNVRMIYWDDAHHLEKMDALKRIIRQAAFYKINAFAIKLEGHFMFKSAPALVEPYALSAEEYQELTDYAKAHYVDVVPYLDAPAHVAFILKHPEYAGLRLYPDNNYQFSVTNPGTEKLLKGMFGDLMDANKGGKMVLFSTDEAYYTGKGGDEIAAAKKLGSNGRLLAKFISTIGDWLHEQGRTVMFWGEFPIAPEDIPAVPAHMVNGVYSKEVAALYQKQGLRQFIYTATQGAEPIFPNYYPSHTKDTVMEDGSDRSSNRVGAMLKEITTAINDKQSTFMGVVIAGWADAGLHPETFWLGYATGTAAGWNYHGATAADLTSRFYNSFYGTSAVDIDTIYRLLSTQAEFFDQSWNWGPSQLRKPILGNSYGILDTAKPAFDQFLPMLPVPAANSLKPAFDWDTANEQRLKLATKFLKENNELQDLLQRNKELQVRHPYNLEVLTSVAALCRQNLEMLLQLQQINGLLKTAAVNAIGDATTAVAMIDSALNVAAAIKTQRDEMLSSLAAVWHKDWQPLVKEANGRTLLLAVDDIKDHQPGRTIDLSYLIYRQLHYPLGKWAGEVSKVRNAYAVKNKLPVRQESLQWETY